MPTRRELVVEIAVMVVIGTALAALGPFGSFAMGSFAERLAYWLPTSFLGYVVFRPVLALTIGMARRLDLPNTAALVTGIAIAAAPATLVVLWWNGQGFGALPSFRDWFELYVNVALLGALITFVFVTIERGSTADATTVREPARPSPDRSPSPFLDRLPPSWNSELAALEMEDHYVRAHGPGASVLILMRLRDAEDELRGIEGLRVHRSWWVARHALEKVVRDGRNLRLRLKGGLEAPVARDRVAVLREAGWLD